MLFDEFWVLLLDNLFATTNDETDKTDVNIITDNTYIINLSPFKVSFKLFLLNLDITRYIIKSDIPKLSVINEM